MTGFQDFNVMGKKDENPPECNEDCLKQGVARLHEAGVKLITKIRCWKDEESGIYRTDEPIRRFPLEGVIELSEGQWWGLCYRNESTDRWSMLKEPPGGSPVEMLVAQTREAREGVLAEEELGADYCQRVWDHCADLAETETFQVEKSDEDDEGFDDHGEEPLETRLSATAVLSSIGAARGHFENGDFERCAYELLTAGDRYSTLRPKMGKSQGAWNVGIEDVAESYVVRYMKTPTTKELTSYLKLSLDEAEDGENAAVIVLWGKTVTTSWIDGVRKNWKRDRF